jgi:hypothetical protein
MKIAVTSDNHVSQISPYGLVNFHAMLQNVSNPDNAVDVFCVAGDIGEGRLMMVKYDLLDQLLGTHPDTLYVMGNHDLYRTAGKKTTPDKAMKDHLGLFSKGTSLETSWDDTSTVVVRGDCSFVGTLGFPDFTYPGLPFPRKCYENNDMHQTIDSQYISLKKWCDWTDKLNAAFKTRLSKAIDGDTKNIVIILHYPCFHTHSHVDVNDRVWPFFYNHQIGVMISDAAKANDKKKFWCIAGHSHEYCRGTWGMEWDNLYTFGIRTTYSQNSCVIFDTTKDPMLDRSTG